MVITREELDNYNYDELDLLSENLQKSSIIGKEIAKIDESIKENDIELGKIDSLKDELVDKFNYAIDDAEKSKVIEEFKELKKKEEEILLKKDELEAKKEELEEQKNMLFNNEKEKVGTIRFFKEKSNKIREKLAIKKEEGFKLPKHKAKEYADKEKEKVKLSERTRNIFTKVSKWAKEDLKRGVGYKVAETIKEKAPEVKEQIKAAPGKVKEWAKEDLKQGVGYKAVETIKEKAPEIKENLHEARRKVGFRINRVTSAIARAPKSARDGLINTFNKAATWVNGKREVIVAKTERFANIAKARVEAAVNRNEQLRQLREDKKRLLEDYKKNVIGKYEEQARKAIEDEYQMAKNGPAPARSI